MMAESVAGLNVRKNSEKNLTDKNSKMSNYVLARMYI